jgi:hypothetical protein
MIGRFWRRAPWWIAGGVAALALFDLQFSAAGRALTLVAAVVVWRACFCTFGRHVDASPRSVALQPRYVLAAPGFLIPIPPRTNYAHGCAISHQRAGIEKDR